MISINKPRCADAKNQRGAALVVSLILLLVMTVIGVSSMGVAVTEIKMATTMQREEIALRRAERTLLAAENAIARMVDDPNSPSSLPPFDFEEIGDAFYPYGKVDPRSPDWSKLNPETGPFSAGDGLDSGDKYVVERLGPRTLDGEDQGCSEDICQVYIWRITAQSVSGKNAVRMVESLYATKGQLK